MKYLVTVFLFLVGGGYFVVMSSELVSSFFDTLLSTCVSSVSSEIVDQASCIDCFDLAALDDETIVLAYSRGYEEHYVKAAKMDANSGISYSDNSSFSELDFTNSIRNYSISDEKFIVSYGNQGGFSLKLGGVVENINNTITIDWGEELHFGLELFPEGVRFLGGVSITDSTFMIVFYDDLFDGMKSTIVEIDENNDLSYNIVSEINSFNAVRLPRDFDIKKLSNEKIIFSNSNSGVCKILTINDDSSITSWSSNSFAFNLYESKINVINDSLFLLGYTHENLINIVMAQITESNEILYSDPFIYEAFLDVTVFNFVNLSSTEFVMVHGKGLGDNGYILSGEILDNQISFCEEITFEDNIIFDPRVMIKKGFNDKVTLMYLNSDYNIILSCANSEEIVSTHDYSNEGSSDLHVFPNPSSNGEITIKIDETENSYESYTVYSMKGEIVLHNLFNGNADGDINLSLPQGVYVIVLNSEKEKKLSKIVIE